MAEELDGTVIDMSGRCWGRWLFSNISSSRPSTVLWPRLYFLPSDKDAILFGNERPVRHGLNSLLVMEPANGGAQWTPQRRPWGHGTHLRHAQPHNVRNWNAEHAQD